MTNDNLIFLLYGLINAGLLMYMNDRITKLESNSNFFYKKFVDTGTIMVEINNNIKTAYDELDEKIDELREE